MADQKPAGSPLKDVDRPPTSRDTKSQSPTEADVEDGAIRQRKSSGIGERPECFKTTAQEVLFIFMATIGLATSTFLTGTTVIVTAAIGKDLGMSQGQISWIAAAPT